MINLKNYICVAPFSNIEIYDYQNFLCCPSWILKKLPDDVPLSELWNSNEAIDIRNSIMDGSYRYCDKNQCPFLSHLIKFNTTSDGSLIHIDLLPKHIKKSVNEKNAILSYGPNILQMNFDKTCNYICPSCRNELYTANKQKINETNKVIDDIKKEFGKDLKWIYITGSGDPFISVSFRNFLRTFDSKYYPKLKYIHLHTNASKWDEKMWNTMKPIHKYVKSCEISVDAGTKYTYENITRIGGDWDVLMNNLKFINTIPNLIRIKVSFVVQQSNYKEMVIFLSLMKKIFGQKLQVFFGKINNWETFTDDEFKKIKVWDSEHPEFLDFKKEINKVCYDPQVFHNMHEFIEKNITII